MNIKTRRTILFLSCLFLLAVCASQAEQIRVTIKNVAPDNGVWIMRPWIGIHDGNFKTFTIGQPASTGVQHIAEDGVTGDPANVLPPSNACAYTPPSLCQFDIFNNYPNHGPQASLGNPTRPGASLSTVFNLDPDEGNNQFLSYMVMIIPSNDAFWGTDSAHPIRLFKHGRFNDGHGKIHFFVFGSDILDAGTEANDEGAAGQHDTAFLNQSVNGTGTHPDPVDSNVHVHPGFIPGGPILTGSNMFGGTLNQFFNANFKQPNYMVAEVTIEQVPVSVDDLITLLNSSNLDPKVTQSLNAKLQAAKNAFNRGNNRAGCGSIRSFVNEVSARTGKSIPADVAASLLAGASQVSQTAGCGDDHDCD
jgi:hypothetical protein